MSKKNKKKQKSLIKDQIQKNQSSLSKENIVPEINPPKTGSNNKEEKEFGYQDKGEERAIKKDIRFTIVLILVVLAFFSLVYYLDLKNDLLIKYANQIFQLVQ